MTKNKQYAIVMTSPNEAANSVGAIWHGYRAGDLVELLVAKNFDLGDGVTTPGFECRRPGAPFTQGIEKKQLWIL